MIAVTELLAHGYYLIAAAAIPMLALMWYAATQYARRGARGDPR